MKQLTFFRNWYELAEAQTDDLKRLAYYDAIMRYAFDGEVPEKPSRRESGDKRAAYFAFLTVQPVIESAAQKSASAKRAIEKRWRKDTPNNTENNTPNNTPYDTPYDTENDTQKNTPYNTPYDTENGTPKNTPNVSPLEKNRIEKNRTSSRAGARGMKPPDTQKEFVDVCVGMGIPEAFSAPLFDELRTNGWCDADGKPIGNWRMYVKSVHNERRNNPPPASDGIQKVRIEDL